MLQLAVLIVGLSIFVRISVAVRHHFVSDKMPRGMLVALIISIVGVFNFSWFVWASPPSALYLVLSVILFASSIAIFEWALLATRNQKFALAFDPKLPDRFITSGPYKFARHPFYVSYIIYWAGCALATLHWVNVLVLAALCAMYAFAAIHEERRFAASRFSKEYAEYRERAGLFWPKW